MNDNYSQSRFVGKYIGYFDKQQIEKARNLLGQAGLMKNETTTLYGHEIR